MIAQKVVIFFSLLEPLSDSYLDYNDDTIQFLCDNWDISFVLSEVQHIERLQFLRSLLFLVLSQLWTKHNFYYESLVLHVHRCGNHTQYKHLSHNIHHCDIPILTHFLQEALEHRLAILLVLVSSLVLFPVSLRRNVESYPQFFFLV